MPRYDFHCDNPECETPDFEMQIPLALYDEVKDGIECPLCHVGHAAKVAAAPGFTLKGAGFHRNDYRGRR